MMINITKHRGRKSRPNTKFIFLLQILSRLLGKILIYFPVRDHEPVSHNTVTAQK